MSVITARSPRAHSDAHATVTHRIGAGLQRTLCEHCDYIGVSEIVNDPTEIGIMIPVAGMARLQGDFTPEPQAQPMTDPWGIAA